MESRFRIFLLTLAGAIFCSGGPRAADAEGSRSIDQEPVIAAPVPRREIHEAAIDTEDVEVGLFAGVLNIEDFGSHAVYGVKIAYHISEDFFAEAALGRSEGARTSFELLNGVDLLTADERTLTYYNLSLGYNLLPGEAFLTRNHALNSAFYLIAGAGSTRFAGDDHFTLNVGAGYRLLLTDALSLHIDARDHMFDSDLLGKNKTTHNIEFTGGLALFF